jgi:predicted RNase H-like HicB family nuclease
MSSRVTFTAVFEPVENGWTQARIAELPGVITAAPSVDQAKEQLVDALREYLLALQQPHGPEGDFVGARGAVHVTIDAA